MDKFNFTPIETSSNKTEYRIGVVGRITPIKGHAFFFTGDCKSSTHISKSQDIDCR